MAIDKLRRLELWARLGFAARGFEKGVEKVAFGFTSLMMARYRRIEDRDVVDDLERGVEKAKASVKS